MKIATWNINSIRAAGRVERVLAVLERHNIDVLALQETKCKTDQFPQQVFLDAGYQVAAHGLNQWNGVAMISRYPFTHINTSFPGQPGFAKGKPADNSLFIDGDLEARALGVTLEIPGSDTTHQLTAWSVYVPNGRALNDPHYHYKLEFLRALKTYAEHEHKADPHAFLMLMGDWNVIPTDGDVWDTDATDGLYLSEAERRAFFAFHGAGLCEVTRQFVTNYTFWDYQKLRFSKNEGMRIDFAYASESLAHYVHNAVIDRDERKGKGASDHVPVIVDLNIA